MTAPLLDAKSISVSYGKVEAVRTVDLALPVGRIVTVIGPNGAGKTTLLNALMGLLPYRGSVTLDGYSLRGLTVEDRVELGLRLVPEKRELFGDMSVADNLILGAYLHRRKPQAVAKSLDQIYERFPRLAERRNQFASTLSGGERQMLALGRALVGQPRLLMLDEPSLGLAPMLVREIFRIIASLREIGVSILLVEQNARAALETADEGHVLENGTFVLSGAATQLMRDGRVERSYLGYK
jgi:branched-chain amino acid transport system ATP-binding protein